MTIKNKPKYIFMNQEGDFFLTCKTEKEMINAKFDLDEENLDYTLYVKQ